MGWRAGGKTAWFTAERAEHAKRVGDAGPARRVRGGGSGSPPIPGRWLLLAAVVWVHGVAAGAKGKADVV
jgi:hypothetical protein